MKKLLNTLYVSTQGIYLRKEGETIVAEKERKVLQRLPIHTLSGLVCFGNVICSPFLLGLCGERGVGVSFMTENGRFLARVEGTRSGNVLLRVEQIKASIDRDRAAIIARSFVVGKILNTRTTILRRIRTHGETERLTSAAARLADVVKRISQESNIDSIRGMEGEAAAVYFGVFNDLLVAQQEAFHIIDRNRRPPTDLTNALLSFFYVLLAHDCAGALKSVGLDAQVGFLHALRPGRTSLALDLMEEFRSVFVDRFIVSLINLKQVGPKDFRKSESGAFNLTEDARRRLLDLWQKRKKEEIEHPFLREKVPVGLLPYLQSLLLARHLRGDLDAYPPFILK